MKSRCSMMALALIVLILGASTALAGRDGKATRADKAAPALKIGVYDSRGIALAYGRSEDYQRTIKQLKQDYEKAKAAGDDKRAKELEQEGPWAQVRLHQRVFSTAGTAGILDKVKDELPGIAREAGVALIVSKWELPFADAAIETVDLTLSIAKLFKPDAQTLEFIEQMTQQAPVSFDELPLDPML